MKLGSLYHLISGFCRNLGMNYESHNFFSAVRSVAFESIPASRRKRDLQKTRLVVLVVISCVSFSYSFSSCSLSSL